VNGENRGAGDGKPQKPSLNQDTYTQCSPLVQKPPNRSRFKNDSSVLAALNTIDKRLGARPKAPPKGRGSEMSTLGAHGDGVFAAL
jgi:hypothetical protein